MHFTVLKHIKHHYKKAVLAFIFCSLLFSANCGKRKPPLPPIEKVSQKVEINGFQRGNQVVLLWTMGARNASEASLQNISRTDIYRLTEPINSPLNLSEDEFASRSTLIATINISDSDFGRKEMIYKDSLEFAGQKSRIRYAIRFANASGQKAGFSNFLLIEPTAKVADSPTDLNLMVGQDSILLKWQSPTKNIDGSTPPNILGYNIYRIENEKNSQKILNKIPITTNEFADKSFEFEKNYTYFVRTVSLGAVGDPIESLESKEIKIVPRDIFAPSPPSALTIAVSPNTVSIFFATNPESDVAGYNIYRSTDPNKLKTEWTLLTPQLLKTNTFQDTNVESGKTYFYYLTAVDKFGNISDFSNLVSATVP